MKMKNAQPAEASADFVSVFLFSSIVSLQVRVTCLSNNLATGAKKLGRRELSGGGWFGRGTYMGWVKGKRTRHFRNIGTPIELTCLS